MAKVKNWAYPLDNIGKPTPPVKKAVAPKMVTGQSINDYLNEIDKAYSQSAIPAPTVISGLTVTGGTGPVYVNTGSWTSSYNNIFNKPAPWPTFFEEPVQDEWSPAPPPIKTIPPKPVPGRLYPVINTGARVEKKALRTFKIYVHDEDEWAQKELKIYKLLTNADGFVPGEDALTLHLTDEPTWYYKVEEFYA